MNHVECAKNKKIYLKSKKDLKRKIKIEKRGKDTASINVLKNKLEKINLLYKGIKQIYKHFLKDETILKERCKMKKYILNTDCTISNKNSETTIPKGTEVVNKNNYIDEDGGVKATIINGEFKGMEIIFSIEELTEI